MSKLLFSIIVPVYKSTTSLKKLANRIKDTFDLIENADYELIFINDSPYYKSTVECLLNLSKNDDKVVVIEFMKNYGQQAATLAGIEYATGDYLITMDDDLQHAPEDIVHLLQKKEHDVVIARFRDKQHSLFKRTTSSVKSYFDHIILGKPKHIKLTSFRLIKADIAKFMFKRKTPYPFIPALLFSITDDIENVELPHHARQDGKSNYTFIKMFQVFSNLLINNSSILLRTIGYIGIAIAILSVIATAVILINKLLYGVNVVGWTSIMLLIIFFGGTIMFTLGIIGEYLLRIIATTEDRPVSNIRKIFDSREVK